MLEPREEKLISIHFIANRTVGISSVGSQKLVSLISKFFRRDKKLNYFC